MAQPGDGPVLFCFDGSDRSRAAMKGAAALISRPVEAVAITVWETVATCLALASAFAASDGGGLGCRRQILCSVSGGRGRASGKGEGV